VPLICGASILRRYWPCIDVAVEIKNRRSAPGAPFLFRVAMGIRVLAFMRNHTCESYQYFCLDKVFNEKTPTSNSE